MAQPVTPQTVDLTNCDREPIHIPGSIQPHAAMLVLREPDLTIVQASINTTEKLGVAPAELLGAPLARFLSAEDLDYLQTRVLPLSLDAAAQYLPPLHFARAPRTTEAIIHRYKGALILELEDWPDRPTLHHQEVFSALKSTLAALHGDLSVVDFCQLAAEHVRNFIGFDRVMVYRFAEDLSGHVIAEAKRDDLEAFLGLHYPASDIPKQARELFKRSKLRLIPDLRYAPVAVQPTLRPDTREPLDMSYSVTRSVSPIHVEYLQNMGVFASLSISIVIDDRLWGLFACHHYSARYVPHTLRMACEFLAHTLSFLVAGREAAEDHDYALHLHEQHRALEEAIARQADFGRALAALDDTTIGGLRAVGAAIVNGSQIHRVGETPDEAQLRALALAVAETIPENIWASDRLAETAPALAAHAPGVAGLLVAVLSRDPFSCVFWFRDEVLKTVNWAGDPTKPVVAGPLGDRLTPRKSFALWQQEVRGHSAAWTDTEIDAARRIRHTYHEVFSRRAQELARLNDQLAERNRQLDAFAYIASHDLKEPLRGIHNFSQFVLEDCAKELNAEGISHLQTITRLTKRMESLLDALLKFSRLSRSEMTSRPVNLNTALDDALDLLASLRQSNGVDIRIPRLLPTVQGDADLIAEIFANLVANAIRYNDKPSKWVEIGYLDPSRPGEPPTLYVADNGIGIPSEHFDVIFRIFKRLHGRDDFGGGTGAGLTIVQKLIERHGGRIWVESKPQAGTRFLFTLAPPSAP